MEFSSVFTHGNLVDLDIGYWTSQKRLTPEDLGIKEDSISDIFSLGHKNLMPVKVIAKFKHLDYKARYILNQHSFPFGFGAARFVPKKKFVEFSTEMDEVIKQFNEDADNFVKNYRSYKMEMRQHYVGAAGKAWDLLKNKRGKSRNDFINNFLERIEKYYPPAEEVRKKFHIDYVVFQVALPDITRASYEDLAEEGEKIKLMQSAYEKVIMRKATEFVDRVAGELRDKAITAIGEVLDSMNKKKILTIATMNKLRTMIDDYETMDILGDTEIRRQLQAFKERFLDVYTAEQVRANKDLKNNLKNDLEILLSIVSDRTAINALVEKYRKNLNI